MADLPSSPLELVQIGELDISAASGLVALEDRLCVIADDELFLCVYDCQARPLRRVPLFPGVLPEAHAARKRAKPDLEALAALPDGRLLALGSGSTAARARGVLIDPGRDFAVRTLDLAPLYAELARRVPELNLEGAAVHDGRLWLAQRGNGAAGFNACIELALERALGELEREAALSAQALIAVHPVQLGEVASTPLGLTDLAADDRAGLLFASAAEPSSSTYDDAPCAGSAIGMLSPRGQVLACRPVAGQVKLEGLAPVHDRGGSGSSIGLFLVADPDDREQAAPLYRAELPL